MTAVETRAVFTQEGDAPVAEADEVRHDFGRGTLAVHRDAGMRGVRVVGQHIGRPTLGFALESGLGLLRMLLRSLC